MTESNKSTDQHTPGPWHYELGGGHAHNRIVGSDHVQKHGWPEPIGGVSNASYSDVVCENLGDMALPGPAANARLIAAAPDLLAALNALALQTSDWSESEIQALGLETTLEMMRKAIAKAEGRTPDPIGDKLRSLPVIGVLNVDDPKDPRHKDWTL